MSVADHQASRMVVDPLRLFDCCIVSDGAAVVLVTTAERARDLKPTPDLHRRDAGHGGGPRRVHLRPAQPRHQSAERGAPGEPRRTRPRGLSLGWHPARGDPGPLHLRRLLAAGAVRAGALRLLRPRRGCGLRTGTAASAPAARSRSTPPAAFSPKPMSPAGIRSARWCANCGARPGRARSRAPAPCNGRRPGAIPSSCGIDGIGA